MLLLHHSLSWQIHLVSWIFFLCWLPFFGNTYLPVASWESVHDRQRPSMSEENTGFEIISPQNYKALIHYLLAFNAAVKKPSATALPSSLYIPHFFPDVSKFFFFITGILKCHGHVLWCGCFSRDLDVTFSILMLMSFNLNAHILKPRRVFSIIFPLKSSFISFL